MADRTARVLQEGEKITLYRENRNLGRWQVIYHFDYLQRVSLHSLEEGGGIISIPSHVYWNTLTERYENAEYAFEFLPN